MVSNLVANAMYLWFATILTTMSSSALSPLACPLSQRTPVSAHSYLGWVAHWKVVHDTLVPLASDETDGFQGA